MSTTPAPPTFSVVIPTYNRAGVLADAVQSALTQTLAPHEVIVVDDGSTDHTETLLQRYAGRVAYVRQSNAGPAAARNRGIETASGQYVSFLDSDDAWAPWTLECFAAAARDFNAPAIIAGHGAAWEQRNDLTRSTARMQESANFLRASANRPAFYGMGGLAVRADVLRRAGGFRAFLLCAEDQDLCLRVGDATGFAEIVSPPLYFQRTNLQHQSNHVENTARAALVLIDEERQRRYPGGETLAPIRRQMICAVARRAAEMCRRAGDRAAALQLYRRCFGWHVALRRWRFLLGFPMLMLRPGRTQS